MNYENILYVTVYLSIALSILRIIDIESEWVSEQSSWFYII